MDPQQNQYQPHMGQSHVMQAPPSQPSTPVQPPPPPPVMPPPVQVTDSGGGRGKKWLIMVLFFLLAGGAAAGYGYFYTDLLRSPESIIVQALLNAT